MIQPFPDRFPIIMGILNVTPDSFYDGGRHGTLKEVLNQAEVLLREGAVILDVGAVSSRPGSMFPDESEELSRLIPVLQELLRVFPGTYLSVDTFRSEVARQAAETGISMVNDIYGGRYDGQMFEVIRKFHLDYVLMHMHGEPGTMQVAPEYTDVVEEVNVFFTQRLNDLQGHSGTVCLDPGFGFGKDILHNFRLLNNLSAFKKHGYPVVAGLSRKSMIWKSLHSSPVEALNGTTVLNTIALMNGADILRVHDARAAAEAIHLVSLLKATGN